MTGRQVVAVVAITVLVVVAASWFLGTPLPQKFGVLLPPPLR